MDIRLPHVVDSSVFIVLSVSRTLLPQRIMHRRYICIRYVCVACARALRTLANKRVTGVRNARTRRYTRTCNAKVNECALTTRETRGADRRGDHDHYLNAVSTRPDPLDSALSRRLLAPCPFFLFIR